MISLGNKLKFNLSDAIHTFARQDRVTAIGWRQIWGKKRSYEKDQKNAAAHYGGRVGQKTLHPL